ncbi:L-threonylcarbamoyladenylate synthase [Virgibacillus sp. W0181]|uniref:L-threonylcarbamoyladenylate synthase n=1 Tax=Virgibacillus sp. W0181 TaxID=3391581 RepID=UPI003F48A1C5
MQTTYWDLTINSNKQTIDEAITEAAACLKKGLPVAFPTETVYGLGADATSEAAVAKIFKAKGRPQDNPLIVHTATKEQLYKLVTHIPPFVEKLIQHFSPGPLTYILPTNGTCAANVTGGLDTIAVRIPDHPIAIQLLEKVNLPIAAPSANVSGKPSPTNGTHVWNDLHGKIAGILADGPTGVGVESTVIDCTGKMPIILRPGGVTKDELEAAVGPVIIDPALANEKGIPKSPGMKYKHYAPDVPLWLVTGSNHKIQEVINEERQLGKRIGVLASTDTAQLLEADQLISLGRQPEEIAAALYEALRTFKERNIDLILCETFPEQGIGQAVMNRLKKAATRIL